MNHFRAWVGVLVCLFIAPLAPGSGLDTGKNRRSSQVSSAISILQQSLVAQTGGATITDVTMKATVTFAGGGQQQTGTITLTGVSGEKSLVSVVLPSGTTSEVRQLSDTGFSGTLTGADGTTQPIPPYNLQTTPNWFYPVFLISSAISSTSYATSLVGPSTAQNAAVQHVTLWRQQTADSVSAATARQHFSSQDLYLDASSFLPVELDYDIHPEQGSALDIPVQILFMNYQPIQGKMCAFHIQVYASNSLIYDIQISSITFNTGAVIASAL